jgi:hypothetical protein
MSGDDVGRMRQLSETLQQMVRSLSQQVYAAQNQPGTGGQGNPPPQNDGTVEGEFREL